ncbi:MAG: hypothetical protein AAF409_13085 [Pseudomonadota bacterium]
MTEQATQLEIARARMPHRGAMQLIEEIAEIDATSIRCISTGHTAAGHPLRLDGVLYVSALVELGAQAAAAHASVHGMGGAHAGLVLAMNDVEIHGIRVDAPRLEILATLAESIHGAARYTFAVDGPARLLSGSLLLSMQMRPE